MTGAEPQATAGQFLVRLNGVYVRRWKQGCVTRTGPTHFRESATRFTPEEAAALVSTFGNAAKIEPA